MLSSKSVRQSSGFTLTELTICIVIVFFLGIIMFPLLKGPKQKEGAPQEMNVALGFLQYIQDYDEKFPPVVSYAYMTDPATGEQEKRAGLFMTSWGPNKRLNSRYVIPGLLSAYVRSDAVFVDPKEKDVKPDSGICLTYMYNDLMVTQEMSSVKEPSRTVLLTSAENRFANAGHAFTPHIGPFAGVFGPNGKCLPGQGATVGQAIFRNNHGSNFAFVDGHVRWFKEAKDGSGPIFFPPRELGSVTAIDQKTHQQIGPIPGKGMTFNGHTYAGTMHLR